MNVMLPSTRKLWWPLIAGVALLALIVGLWVANQERTIRSHGGGADEAAPPVEIPEAVIEQVAWKVKVFPAGIASKLTSSQKAAVQKNGVPAGEAVTKVTDALVFEPNALGALSGRDATAGAARALARSKLVPAGIEDVKVIRRVARIGIDVAGANRAAAKVAIGFKGALKGETVRLNLTAAFWLERYSGGWKVVAFEGDSKPYRAPEGKKDGKGRADGSKGNRKDKNGKSS